MTNQCPSHDDLTARVAELEAELEGWRSREWDTAFSLERMNAAAGPLDRTLRGLILELRRGLFRPGEWGRHAFYWVRDGALHVDSVIVDAMTRTCRSRRRLVSAPYPLRHSR